MPRCSLVLLFCCLALHGWLQPTYGQATPEDDPLVSQLMLRAASKDDIVVADAIASLARIGRWAEVDALLARLGTKQREAPVMAEMAKRLGPTLLLKMKRSELLNEPAKKTVQQLTDALNKASENPAPIRKAIDELDDASVDKRLAAIRVVMAGGKVSIAELVQAIVSENPPADLDTLLRTMLRLGDGGTLALRQVALYGEPAMRGRALAALRRISANEHRVDLASALHASDATDVEKQVAVQGFTSMQLKPPSLEDAVAYLTLELQSATEAAQRATQDDAIVTTWHLASDGASVRPIDVNVSLAAAHARAGAAARLLRISPLPESVAIDAVIADLSYRVSVDPLWGTPAETKPLRDAYASRLGESWLLTCMDRATSMRDWPAVLGFIKFIDASTSTAQAQRLVQDSGAGQPSALVRAVLAPVTRVRYEAALAIAKLDVPDPTFAGASFVAATLAEMTRLSERPIAILVETLPELVQRQESFLRAAGFRVDVVVSVAELERRIAEGGDLRLVLSKIELADARPIELVDRVRRLPFGEELPILFYGDDPDALNNERFNVLTAVIAQPRTELPVNRLLLQWSATRRLPELIESERVLLRGLAEETLRSFKTRIGLDVKLTAGGEGETPDLAADKPTPRDG